MRQQRLDASELLGGPDALPTDPGERAQIVDAARDALLAAKVAAFAQGMSLIRAASSRYHWSVDLGELARIWKGGCIIRARFLDAIMDAFGRQPDLESLLLDEPIRRQVNAAQRPWREVVALAQRRGLPVPGLAAGLAYYDSYRAARLPANLIQAQRDAFGAHTYRLLDDPEGDPQHTDWLGLARQSESRGARRR